MAGDWTVYWLASPFGSILVGAVVGLSFLIWRTTLGADFAAIGVKPLVFAYLYAGIGLLGTNFVGCYLDFSDRVASGILAESQRWSVVPDWTIYATLILLVIVLPLLGFVGAPLAAAVLKRAWLTPRHIALAMLVAWLALGSLGLVFPTDEWHRTHRFASFLAWLKNLLPAILFIALPFTLAIYSGSRSYRLRVPAGST